ncbi:hypothetical protein A1Q2_01277 [Trichosporon asahii var. asahii CBS 8904]|uniref:Uncharacterized protein n=1 Tax=Trichosporon asahii var. asahii (strain CBS 8904) TaxID=1220162 RepID=K1W648_TRIAC|nr:hypothetical protein A1Q2_01277 [Trichosporon asahii var. asahii CBS 8904]
MSLASILLSLAIFVVTVLSLLRLTVKLERWAELREIERAYLERRKLHEVELEEKRALARKGEFPPPEPEDPEPDLDYEYGYEYELDKGLEYALEHELHHQPYPDHNPYPNSNHDLNAYRELEYELDPDSELEYELGSALGYDLDYGSSLDSLDFDQHQYSDHDQPPGDIDRHVATNLPLYTNPNVARGLSVFVPELNCALSPGSPLLRANRPFYGKLWAAAVRAEIQTLVPRPGTRAHDLLMSVRDEARERRGEVVRREGIPPISRFDWG